MKLPGCFRSPKDLDRESSAAPMPSPVKRRYAGSLGRGCSAASFGLSSGLVDATNQVREELPMFLGLRTVVYEVRDMEAAKTWYGEVLGFGPYFDEPFYVGFNVGGFELGLLPSEGEGSGATGALGGGTAYWGVPDIEAAMDRLVDLGATLHEPAKDVGGDIRVGTVITPFGNLLGVIYNPHFELPSD